jgi:hypothetical protein
MTIRAANQSFIHAVPEWLVEINGCSRVALITKCRLFFCQQSSRLFGEMERVAGDATNVGRGVSGLLKVCNFLFPRVASKTMLYHFLRHRPSKGKYFRPVTTRGNVFGTRAMASFATVCLFLSLQLQDAIPVASFLCIFENIFVASLAGIGSDV